MTGTLCWDHHTPVTWSPPVLPLPPAYARTRPPLALLLLPSPPAHAHPLVTTGPTTPTNIRSSRGRHRSYHSYQHTLIAWPPPVLPLLPTYAHRVATTAPTAPITGTRPARGRHCPPHHYHHTPVRLEASMSPRHHCPQTRHLSCACPPQAQRPDGRRLLLLAKGLRGSRAQTAGARYQRRFLPRRGPTRAASEGAAGLDG